MTAGLLLYKKHAKAGGGDEGAAGGAGGGGGGGSVGCCGGGGNGGGGDISGHVDKNSVKRVCGAMTQALALGEDADTMSQELAFVYKYYKVRVCVYTYRPLHVSLDMQACFHALTPTEVGARAHTHTNTHTHTHRKHCGSAKR